jgi:hypothetical protein
MKEEQRLYRLINIDNEIRDFKNDEDFIAITNLIQDENEHHFILETTEQCINYINNYCDNLTLIIT